MSQPPTPDNPKPFVTPSHSCIAHHFELKGRNGVEKDACIGRRVNYRNC